MLFTMFFSGGLIPTYLLIKQLGFLDSIWALILPNAVSIWNLIIAKTYFRENIPEELADAAFIDGCSHFKFFLCIVLPLSSVIIIAVTLFYAVSHWNGFFNALIYISSQEKVPLQLFLRDILIQQQNVSVSPEVADTLRYTANLVQYAMIVVSSAPDNNSLRFSPREVLRKRHNDRFGKRMTFELCAARTMSGSKRGTSVLAKAKKE